MEAFRAFVPTEVIFGQGCLEGMGERCGELGSKPLIVTGKSSAKMSGALDAIFTHWGKAPVFDEVTEDPTTAVCEEGAARCRAEGCDFIIAAGGGSPIDAAKAMAALVANGGACADYFGTDKFSDALPVVAIPTTAGTGSEVTPYAVLVDEAQPAKKTIRGRGIFPKVAYLDPVFTATMPRDVTIHTGLDALSQGMEGMVSTGSTPMTDVLGLEVCRLVKEWLPGAAASDATLDARAHMLYAAMLSGWVIAHTGTTLVHGMGYQYTLHHGVAHGLANALLLTPVFQRNAEVCPEKVGAIAAALGVPVTGNGISEAIGEAIHALLHVLGVSPRAADAGVDSSSLGQFAQAVYGDPGRFRRQRGEFTRDEVREIYGQSYEGRR